MPDTNQRFSVLEQRQLHLSNITQQRKSSWLLHTQICVMVFMLLSCLVGHYTVYGFSLKHCRVAFTRNLTINMSVFCSQKNLLAVPDDIPQLVVFLDLGNNKISHIRKSDLKKTSLLRDLNLTHNHISHVEDGAFVKLQFLERLNLAYNNLTVISDQMFIGLNQLLYLQLDSNRITSFQNSTFAFCSNLEVLDLSSNCLDKLETIHHILQHLPHLHELYIQNNRYNYFYSQDISNKSLELKLLDLSQNPLKVIRLTADIFPKLTKLYIDDSCQEHGMIWDVQNKFFLRNVTVLRLSGVNMSCMVLVLKTFNSVANLKLKDEAGINGSLIDVACQIPTLTTLLLRNNKIVTLSMDLLKSCNQVTFLDVSNNGITNLNESSFGSQPQLTSLKMESNNLSSVPTVIRNLSSLDYLDFSHNSIHVLGCSDFANLTRLRKLYFSSNHLSKLEDCVFQDLNALEILVLSNNKIHHLNKVFQNSLPSLKVLYLNSNKLTNINQHNFRNLRSLIHLSLGNNRIHVLESGAFKGLDHLEKLVLSQNEIDSGKQGIRQEVFTGLRNLLFLNLFDNKIQYDTDKQVHNPPFAHLSSLKTLVIFTQHHRDRKSVV